MSERSNREIDVTALISALQNYKWLGQDDYMNIYQKVTANSELQKSEEKMNLEHPLRADPDRMEVFFISNIDSQSLEAKVKLESDDAYLRDLQSDVKNINC